MLGRRWLTWILVFGVCLLLPTGAFGKAKFSKKHGQSNTFNTVDSSPAAFSGEVLRLAQLGYTGADTDVSAAGNYFINTELNSEVIDSLGHWQVRAQGYDVTDITPPGDGFIYDNVVCYEPAYTYRVWMRDHCSGSPAGPGTLTEAFSWGRLCRVGTDTDCEGSAGGETCLGETFNYATDIITITAHPFGAIGDTFPIPMGFSRHTNEDPVHNYGTKLNPNCAPAMDADGAENYWVHVEGANTISLHRDDGDLVPQIGGADTQLDCTDGTGGWQSIALYPRNMDGSDIEKRFQVNWTHAVHVIDGTGGAVTEEELLAGWQVCLGGFEIIDTAVCAIDFNEMVNETYLTHNSWKSTFLSDVITMSPANCLGVIGYVWGQTANELDTMGPQGGVITILEAERSAAQRYECPVSTDGAVGIECMGYGLITNRGATANVEVELAAMSAGMDFCVVNEAAGDHTLNIDPNGADRFQAPATDANGDSLQSVLQGDTFCATVLTDHIATVTYNSGGYVDAN